MNRKTLCKLYAWMLSRLTDEEKKLLRNPRMPPKLSGIDAEAKIMTLMDKLAKFG